MSAQEFLDYLNAPPPPLLCMHSGLTVDECKSTDLCDCFDEGGYKIKMDDEVREEVGDDPVHSPRHYNSHPSGVECIAITEHMSFCVGNVVKYAWRADEKGNDVEDLRKAAWYLAREIERREAVQRP